MKRYYSPLRYPGGKARLGSYLKDIIERNFIVDGIYVEPYAGGAGIGLDLLINEYVQEIYINDIDYGVYCFWKSMLNKTEEFCELITDTDIDVETWKQMRDIQRNQIGSELDIGFALFYLNRTNKSGIINGGVIGGLNQIGKWKIDARFNKVPLIERIEMISRYKDRVHVSNEDACFIIMKMKQCLPKEALFYIDPPYFMKGKDLYEHHYHFQDHLTVSEVIKTIWKQNWVLTYDYHPSILELYQNYRYYDYELLYSASVNRKGKEVVFFSDMLNIPNNSPLMC